MIYGRPANEPPDYLFEAFDAWEDNEDDDLLGRGSNYHKEQKQSSKKSKIKMILIIIQVISIAATVALASNLVAIIFINKKDISGSSSSGGMQIKPAGTEKSLLRGKDMHWNEIKNDHNPYQFDDSASDIDLDEVSRVDDDEEELETIWRKRDKHEDSNGKIDINKEDNNLNDNKHKINEKVDSHGKESNTSNSNEREGKTDQEHQDIPSYSSIRKSDDDKSEFDSKEQDENSFAWSSLSDIKDTDSKVEENEENRISSENNKNYVNEGKESAGTKEEDHQGQD